MPKGPDKRKSEKIKKTLRERGKIGIWLRELARQTGLPTATVYYYLRNFMKNEVDIRPAVFGGIRHRQMKMVKLKG